MATHMEGIERMMEEDALTHVAQHSLTANTNAAVESLDQIPCMARVQGSLPMDSCRCNSSVQVR